MSRHARCTPPPPPPPPSLTLALVWSPHDAVGGLPGLVVVERCAALAVVASCVVSAHTLPVDLPGKYHGQDRGFFFLFFGGFFFRRGSGRFKASPHSWINLQVITDYISRRRFLFSPRTAHSDTFFIFLGEVRPRVPICKELSVTLTVQFQRAEVLSESRLIRTRVLLSPTRRLPPLFSDAKTLQVLQHHSEQSLQCSA